MPSVSTADHSTRPPRITIPREYNAAHDLIERNLAAGRGGKIAYIDDRGVYTYAELAERSRRCANALTGLGLAREQRVLLCLLDSIDFPAAFLGSIEAGIVPGRRQYVADRRRLRVHAARQPRQCIDRFGAAPAQVRPASGQRFAPEARDRVGRAR
jgi:acyl-CoA synthetase (AMP-forming)/AMP-acid ligase II